jgi:hypothetical protein
MELPKEGREAQIFVFPHGIRKFRLDIILHYTDIAKPTLRQ